MTLTVYVEPKSVQCSATIRFLDKYGLDYEVVDLMVVPGGLTVIEILGYTQAPVVLTSSGDHWSGFRPDRIQELALSDKGR